MPVSYTKKTKTPVTLCEAIEQSLHAAARYNRGAEEKPVAVLWTDADGQWLPVIAKLRGRLPQILTLGDYQPVERTGPAIWIKCVLARTIDVGIPGETTPIVYLPNVSRQLLRAAADCPLLLQPMVELQYRGAVWTQRNGKDWTVEAFLMSDDALGLDVAKDDGTRRSIHAALPALAEASLAALRNKRLEAEDFDKLMVGDQPRDLLEWMNDPEAVQKRWPEGKWHAFRSRCRKDYGFDPESEGALGAAERLGLRKEEGWQNLWNRFCEAPAIYKALPDLLTQAKPVGELVFDGETWPDENDRAEARLRASLLDLEGMEAGQARKRIAELDKEHGPRRSWVWNRLGRAPLAEALAALAQLAERTEKPLTGATAEELALRYEEGGYEADAALIRALSIPRTNPDKAAVQTAGRAVYLPWARAAAELLQQQVATTPLPGAGDRPGIDVRESECIVFADGLRFDLGQRLHGLCAERGLKVAGTRRWAALPTVTATAKPAVSPIADQVSGGITLPESFAPNLKGEEMTTARFRKALTESGYPCLSNTETGDPSGKAWTECGKIDTRGHEMQIGMVGQIAEELEQLTDRIVELLDAGWASVRVVTDHGWLLMPGGLPKTELPGFLVASRWSRCAAIKGDSKVSVPKVTWHWNRSAETAIAPHISAFVAGQDYAHGGVSLQECVIPELTISFVESKKAAVQIKQVEWQRLRCRITLDPPTEGVMVDIRTKANLPDSSVVASAKATDADGQVSLMVPDEDNAGMAATVVALDAGGHLISKQPTTIGES
ncbi:MAG: BREX-1 system phosphatase PglZ type B [Verrucomicrobiales bacterium]|nr:BREX-1 system phosphatase PglZ type B [Verrucomicrobiales bacterium]